MTKVVIRSSENEEKVEDPIMNLEELLKLLEEVLACQAVQLRWKGL